MLYNESNFGVNQPWPRQSCIPFRIRMTASHVRITALESRRSRLVTFLPGSQPAQIPSHLLHQLSSTVDLCRIAACCPGCKIVLGPLGAAQRQRRPA